MPYVKVVLLLCAVAILLGTLLNLLFHLGARLAGGAIFGATHFGWSILLFGWWTSSFFLGLYIANVLRIFPFSTQR